MIHLVSSFLIILGIILILASIWGLVICLFVIGDLCLYRGHDFCKCSCFCRCFRNKRIRSSYEEIYDVEKCLGNGQDNCTVCLEDMKINDDLYRAWCGHKFHTHCLERWLEEDNRCPLCNCMMQSIRAANTQESL